MGSRTHYADIVILRDGRPWAIIECKSRAFRSHDRALGQSVSYATAQDVGAEFAVYTNGEIWLVRRRYRGQWVAIPDIPRWRGECSGDDVSQLALAVSVLGPVLYWLDEHVPARESSHYFAAMQRFFGSRGVVTAATDARILKALDHISGVLSRPTNAEPFLAGKLGAACQALEAYFTSVGEPIAPDGADLFDLAHSAWGMLSGLIDGALNLPVPDACALRLCVTLLDHIGKTRAGCPVEIAFAVQDAVRCYIDLSLTVQFDTRLPDSSDSTVVGVIRRLSEPAWRNFMERDAKGLV